MLQEKVIRLARRSAPGANLKVSLREGFLIRGRCTFEGGGLIYISADKITLERLDLTTSFSTTVN